MASALSWFEFNGKGKGKGNPSNIFKSYSGSDIMKK
jgi:hypothetical protein